MAHKKSINMCVILVALNFPILSGCVHILPRYVEPTENDAAKIDFVDGSKYSIEQYDKFGCLQDHYVSKINSQVAGNSIIKAIPGKRFDFAYRNQFGNMSCFISLSFVPEALKYYVVLNKDEVSKKEKMSVFDWLRGSDSEGTCSVGVFEKNGESLRSVELKMYEEKVKPSLEYGLYVNRNRRWNCMTKE